MRDDGGLDILQVDGVAEALLNRGHDSPVVAARPDLEEFPQVGRHVEGEAGERHLGMAREPDRCDLLPADPDTALRSLARRVDPEVGAGAKDNLLEVRHEALHLEAVREFQDRIADELTRSVVGRLAAALDLDDLEPWIQDLLARPASAEGRDRIVLDEDEAVGDLVLRTAIDEGLLELPHLPVRLAPEIQEPRISDDEDRGRLALRRREHGVSGSARGAPYRAPPPRSP